MQPVRKHIKLSHILFFCFSIWFVTAARRADNIPCDSESFHNIDGKVNLVLCIFQRQSRAPPGIPLPVKKCNA